MCVICWLQRLSCVVQYIWPIIQCTVLQVFDSIQPELCSKLSGYSGIRCEYINLVLNYRFLSEYSNPWSIALKLERWKFPRLISGILAHPGHGFSRSYCHPVLRCSARKFRKLQCCWLCKILFDCVFFVQAIAYYQTALNSGGQHHLRFELVELLLQLKMYDKVEKILTEVGM